MKMLRALRRRAIALLWGGQALSAVGDEIYRVALIWLAVGLIGERAGYLAAAQLAALLALSLAGGHWADHWDHRPTMAMVDLWRGLIVLLPVAAFFLGGITLPLLFGVAMAVSALSAFFDPALQATIPEVSFDEDERQAATALMGTTSRMARAVGPGLIALLSGLVPMIHFFTVDSASFLCSAISVAALPRRSESPVRPPRTRFRDSVLAGWRAMAEDGIMRDLLLVRAAVNALWSLAYGLALALMVQRLSPGDVGAFGGVVAFYGVGNVLGALFVGQIRRERPWRISYAGYLWLGLGFLAMGAAGGLRGLRWASFLAAIGGPINDVPYYDLLQARYPGIELPRIFRFVRSCETAASLLLLAVSPVLLRVFAPGPVVVFCGAAIAALGAAGLYSSRRAASVLQAPARPALDEGEAAIC